MKLTFAGWSVLLLFPLTLLGIAFGILWTVFEVGWIFGRETLRESIEKQLALRKAKP